LESQKLAAEQRKQKGEAEKRKADRLHAHCTQPTISHQPLYSKPTRNPPESSFLPNRLMRIAITNAIGKGAVERRRIAELSPASLA